MGDGEGETLAEGLVESSSGRGGVSRGRGDAALSWGEEAQGRSEDFKAEALDPAKVLDAESTGVLGIGATSPTVDAQGEASGVAQVQASSGEGAWRRRLAPHHREAVKQFFSGPKKE